MAEEWLTTEQAAELSGYHPDHIRRLIRGGDLQARKFGPVWQVNRQALSDYLEAAKESGDKRRGPK